MSCFREKSHGQQHGQASGGTQAQHTGLSRNVCALMTFVSLCLICCLWHGNAPIPPLALREGTVNPDSMVPDLEWAWREMGRGLSGS